jgi:hypothetical protein
MDPLIIIKIIAAAITVIISLAVGIRVLLLNPSNLLNRWFTLFFMSSSLGFLIYTIYHLILTNAQLVIILMIVTQFFFNFIFISLMMTVFILEKYKKVAMSPRYLGVLMILFVIMSVGYIIFTPYLDYSYPITINTITPPEWFVTIITIRALLAIYVVYKYAQMSRKIDTEIRKRVQWFFIGVIFIIGALIIDLIGGALNLILIEVIALFSVDVATLAIFRGFLIK